jgi:hypothetical protein
MERLTAMPTVIPVLLFEAAGVTAESDEPGEGGEEGEEGEEPDGGATLKSTMNN